MNRVETRALCWTATFVILAIVAGLLGFASIAGASAGIAQGLLAIFLVLLVVSGIASALRRHSSPY
jgi:uncharacterized membrane protein YtjA (UPF0391 family)